MPEKKSATRRPAHSICDRDEAHSCFGATDEFGDLDSEIIFDNDDLAGHLASPELPDWSGSVEDEVIARELAGRAGEFIADLPAPYRDVIWMYDVEEMATADIAETLRISIPALKSRLHRARLYVRQRLSEISKGPAQAEAR